MGNISFSKKRMFVYLAAGFVVTASGAGGWYALSRRSVSDQPKPRVSVEVDALTAEAATVGRGSLEDAITKLSAYIDSQKGSNTERSAVYQARASYYAQQPDGLQKAIADLEKALELTPNDLRVHLALGGAYRTAGNSVKSKELYDLALTVYDSGDSEGLPEGITRDDLTTLASATTSAPSGNLSEPEGEEPQ